MVYGAIIEKSEEYYTYLDRIFYAINNEQLNYNWLITDCVCYPSDSRTATLFEKEYCWLTGEELTKIIEQEPFQWIWSVLSGFSKDISLTDVLKYPLPYANGYTGFWENPLTMQNPLASVEIVPWDGLLTLIFSNKKLIVDNFIDKLPLSEDLVVYNAK